MSDRSPLKDSKARAPPEYPNPLRSIILTTNPFFAKYYAICVTIILLLWNCQCSVHSHGRRTEWFPYSWGWIWCSRGERLENIGSRCRVFGRRSGLHDEYRQNFIVGRVHSRFLISFCDRGSNPCRGDQGSWYFFQNEFRWSRDCASLL